MKRYEALHLELGSLLYAAEVPGFGSCPMIGFDAVAVTSEFTNGAIITMSGDKTLLQGFSTKFGMVYNYCGLSNLGLPRDEEAFARATKFILRNLASGKLKPIIANTFRLSKIREAHRYMESNQQLGKIVVAV
jgi:NADPH:quinone reductase-like Zn-dependent oxidoreductase